MWPIHDRGAITNVYPEIGKVCWIDRAKNSDELCKFWAGIRIWMVGATSRFLQNPVQQGIEFVQKSPNAHLVTVVLPSLHPSLGILR